MKTIHLFVSVGLVACATQSPPPALTQAPLAPHAAHQLLVDTEACFVGGMWGDVQGESQVERELSSERRCSAVVDAVFARDPHDRYLELRAPARAR